MSPLVYFPPTGNWYAPIQTTAAGESPVTHPQKWALVEIPAKFERFLVQQAYANLLPGEGQNDKRSMEENKATEILEVVALQELTQSDSIGSRRSRRYP